MQTSRVSEHAARRNHHCQGKNEQLRAIAALWRDPPHTGSIFYAYADTHTLHEIHDTCSQSKSFGDGQVPTAGHMSIWARRVVGVARGVGLCLHSLLEHGQHTRHALPRRRSHELYYRIRALANKAPAMVEAVLFTVE